MPEIEIIETWGRTPRTRSRLLHVVVAAVVLGVLVAPLAFAANSEPIRIQGTAPAAKLVCDTAKPCLNVRNAGGTAAKFVGRAGRAPFEVGPDTTKVPNLNADLLDGKSADQILAEAAQKSGPAGAQGPQGPKGDKGDPGVQGAPGSDAQFNGAAAGGDLDGTYPDPVLADDSIDSVNLFTAGLRDGAAATPTLRSLGTGASQAAAGNDARLSDARIPTGTADGDLDGTYPNPTLEDGSVTASRIGAMPLYRATRSGNLVVASGSPVFFDVFGPTQDFAPLPAGVVAQVPGIYEISTQLRLQNPLGDSSEARFCIRVNGASVVCGNAFIPMSQSGQLVASGLFQLAAGDTISVNNASPDIWALVPDPGLPGAVGLSIVRVSS